MYFETVQFNFLVMYFIYGLAFFSMGLAMALEEGRSTSLAEPGFLKPLAAFGMLNAVHQWLEIVVLHGTWMDMSLPKPLILTKLAFLAFSYTSLIAFGAQALRPTRQVRAGVYAGLFFLLLYIGAILVNHLLPWKTPPNCLKCADALARYILALPGATLAALALFHRARQARKEQSPLASSFLLAAFGFALYAFTQIFAYRAAIYPAPFINSELFQEMTGIPIQLIRTVLALFTMGNLIRASQLAEKLRQQELLGVQQEKLDALEQVKGELLKRKELRQKLLRHIVLAQEEERSRISRELHDDTAQILTAASLNMAALKNVVEKDDKAVTLLERSQDLCQEMSQALYRLVHDLRPAQLDDLGLVSALHHLTDENRFSKRIKIDFKASGTQQRVNPVIETVLFRVAQEALTNVIRHAKTDQAALHIIFEEDSLILRVSDQGVGFNMDLQTTDRFGLAGVVERVELIGGTCTIASTPGKGTTMTVTVPLEKSKENKAQEAA